MVNHGRSKGCNTCKDRRVKCDEGKPSCQHCQRLGRVCGGYDRRPLTLKFKVVQNASSVQIPRKRHYSPVRYVASDTKVERIIPPIALAKNDAAVSFFLCHFAVMGRDLASTRGFFESIPQILSKEHHASAVYLAVTAVATMLLNLCQEGPRSLLSPNEYLPRAFSRLQVAIENPIESRSPATILATLLLQFYENLWAVHMLCKANRTHHNGAVALLKHQGPDASSTLHGLHLMSYVLHCEVSSAIREKRPLTLGMLSWYQHDVMLPTPSSTLDIIGVAIANLQYKFSKLPSKGHFITTARQDIVGLWEGTQAIATELLHWIRSVPAHWQPIEQECVETCAPPMITYSGVYEIYPSIQVAAIWNVWRCYRLILLKMSLAILHFSPQLIPSLAESNGRHADDNIDERSVAQQEVQDVVDSICRSVPFFLGNRIWQTTISDLTDPCLKLPGYHSLDTSKGSFPDYIKDVSYMSRDEHSGHVIVQGPWHMMSQLSQLVGLCSEPHGSLLSKALRPGQLEWIREQLVRVATLSGMKTGGPAVPSGNVRPATTEAASLAGRIREGLTMTSGS